MMTGTFRDGRPNAKKDAPLYAVFSGQRQDVFYIEPDMLIPAEVTPNYEKNPLPNLSNKTKLVSF